MLLGQSGNERTRILEAEEALTRGDYGQAARIYQQRARELAGREVPFEAHDLRVALHRQAASCLVEAGDLDEAVEEWVRALRLDPADAGLYYGLAWSYFSRGEIADAENYARQALQLNPQLAEAILLLGRVAERRGQWLEALEFSRRYLSLLDGSADSPERESGRSVFPGLQAPLEEQLQDVLRIAARACLYLERSAEALEWTEELLRLVPGDTESFWIRGNALLRREDVAGAEAAFRLAAEHHAPSALELARLHHYLTGDRSAALQAYENYHRRVDDRDSARFLAEFLIEEGRYADALVVLGPAGEADDSFLLLRAECLLGTGQHAALCQTLDRYFAAVDWKKLDPPAEPVRATEFFHAIELQARRFVVEDKLEDARELLAPLINWSEYRPGLVAWQRRIDRYRQSFAFRLLVPRTQGGGWLARFYGAEMESCRAVDPERDEFDPLLSSSLPLGLPLEADEGAVWGGRGGEGREIWNLLEFHLYVHPGSAGEDFRQQVDRLRECGEEKHAGRLMRELAAIFRADCQKILPRAETVRIELERAGLQGWNVYGLIRQLATLEPARQATAFGPPPPPREKKTLTSPLTPLDQPSFQDIGALADWLAEREDCAWRVLLFQDPERGFHRLVRSRSALAPLLLVLPEDRKRRRLQKLLPHLLIGRETTVDFLDDLAGAPCRRRLQCLKDQATDPADRRLFHWMNERLRKGGLEGLADDTLRFARAGGMTRERLDCCLRSLQARPDDCGGDACAGAHCPRRQARIRFHSVQILISSGRFAPEELGDDEIVGTPGAQVTIRPRFRPIYLHFLSARRYGGDRAKQCWSSLDMLSGPNNPAVADSRLPAWLKRLHELCRELPAGSHPDQLDAQGLLDLDDTLLIPARLAFHEFPEWHRRLEERWQDGVALAAAVSPDLKRDMEAIRSGWATAQLDLLLAVRPGLVSFHRLVRPADRLPGIVVAAWDEFDRLERQSPGWQSDWGGAEFWRDEVPAAAGESESRPVRWKRSGDWLRDLPLDARCLRENHAGTLQRDYAYWWALVPDNSPVDPGAAPVPAPLWRLRPGAALSASLRLAWQSVCGKLEDPELPLTLARSGDRSLCVELISPQAAHRLLGLLAWMRAALSGQRQILLAVDENSLMDVEDFLQQMGLPFVDRYILTRAFAAGETVNPDQPCWILDADRALPGSGDHDPAWQTELELILSRNVPQQIAYPLIRGSGLLPPSLVPRDAACHVFLSADLQIDIQTADDRVDQAYRVVKLLQEHSRALVVVPAREYAAVSRALRARSLRLEEEADVDSLSRGWRFLWKEHAPLRRAERTRLVFWRQPGHPRDLLELLGRCRARRHELIFLSRRRDPADEAGETAGQERLVHNYFSLYPGPVRGLSLEDLSGEGILPRDQQAALAAILRSLCGRSCLERRVKKDEGIFLHWRNQDDGCGGRGDGSLDRLREELVRAGMDGPLAVRRLRRQLGLSLHQFQCFLSRLERCGYFHVEGELILELRDDLSALQQDVGREMETRQSILAALADFPGFLDGFEFPIDLRELTPGEWPWLRELIRLEMGGLLRVESADGLLRVFRAADSNECRNFLRREEAARRLLLDVMRGRCRRGSPAVFVPRELAERMEQLGQQALPPPAIKAILLRWQRLGLLSLEFPPLWGLEGPEILAREWTAAPEQPQAIRDALRSGRESLAKAGRGEEFLAWLAAAEGGTREEK